MKKKSGKHNTSQPESTADPAGPAPAEQAAEPVEQSDLEVALAERDRLQDQLQRAFADLQNIRKRHGKEMDEARKRAIEALAGELLPVLDNFELALAAHEQNDAGDGADDPGIVEGVRMVRGLLRATLERHGLAEIPALGMPFDPNIHEAVGVDPSGEVAPGHVSMVMLHGYTMGERVIRPAKVMVAAEPSSAGSDEQPSDEQPSDEQPSDEQQTN